MTLLLLLPEIVEWKKDEFAEAREFACTPTANKTEVLKMDGVKIGAIVNTLHGVRTPVLLQV